MSGVEHPEATGRLRDDEAWCSSCRRLIPIWPGGEMYWHVVNDHRVLGGFKTCPGSPYYNPREDPDVNPVAADAPPTRRRGRHV